MPHHQTSRVDAQSRIARDPRAKRTSVSTMVSTAGGIAIAIVVLLAVAAAGWVVFTQLRARRLGLPWPSLSSYLPWRQRDKPYGPPRPAPGGVVGWINDQVRKFRNRGSRSAGGAGSGRWTRTRRGTRASHARVGHEADSYDYGGYGYEEQELGGGGLGGGRGSESDHDEAAGAARRRGPPTPSTTTRRPARACAASVRGPSTRRRRRRRQQPDGAAVGVPRECIMTAGSDWRGEHLVCTGSGDTCPQ